MHEKIHAYYLTALTSLLCYVELCYVYDYVITLLLPPERGLLTWNPPILNIHCFLYEFNILLCVVSVVVIVGVVLCWGHIIILCAYVLCFMNASLPVACLYLYIYISLSHKVLRSDVPAIV